MAVLVVLKRNLMAQNALFHATLDLTLSDQKPQFAREFPGVQKRQFVSAKNYIPLASVKHHNIRLLDS